MLSKNSNKKKYGKPIITKIVLENLVPGVLAGCNAACNPTTAKFGDGCDSCDVSCSGADEGGG